MHMGHEMLHLCLAILVAIGSFLLFLASVIRPPPVRLRLPSRIGLARATTNPEVWR